MQGTDLHIQCAIWHPKSLKLLHPVQRTFGPAVKLKFGYSHSLLEVAGLHAQLLYFPVQKHTLRGMNVASFYLKRKEIFNQSCKECFCFKEHIKIQISIIHIEKLELNLRQQEQRIINMDCYVSLNYKNGKKYY